MKYPIAIHQEGDSAYGVTIPDIAGCFSAGDSLDEALDNTLEAIKGHLELLAEDGIAAPIATSIEQHKNNTDYKDAIWAVVDIDISAYSGKTEKFNVTLPKIVSTHIEALVKQGLAKSRSAFLTDAAIRQLSAYSKQRA